MVEIARLPLAVIGAFILITVLASCAHRDVAPSPNFAAEPDPAKTEVAALVQYMTTHPRGDRIDGDYVNFPRDALREYLNKHGIDDSFLDSILPRTFYAEMLGRYAVICTCGQYKMNGFVIFIDSLTNAVALLDTRFPLGVVKVKSIHDKNASPQSLFIVTGLSSSGTGLYGERLRVYTIDNGGPILSLEKPYYDVISGWGAFKAHAVEFKQRNDYVVRNGAFEIRTTGIAVTEGVQDDEGNDIEEGTTDICRQLPDEVYIYSRISKQFEQVRGRITNGEYYQMAVYGDYSIPKGDWFKVPHSVGDAEEPPTDNIYDASKFVHEEWDGNDSGAG